MTQSHLQACDGQPTLAQTATPTVISLSLTGLPPDAVPDVLSPAMKPVHGISFSATEIHEARLRRAYAINCLSDEEVEKAKSVPGWTWNPVMPRDILTLWSVNIEADLDEGRGSNNRFVNQRIQESHRIRLNGLADPTSSNAILTALRSIDDEVIRGYIDVPRDTVRMAAVDLVEWVYGEFNPDDPNEEERIAGYSEYAWTRDYLDVTHQFVAPETSPGVLDTDSYGDLTGDKNPLRSDILRTFFRAFLDKSRNVCDSFDDAPF